MEHPRVRLAPKPAIASGLVRIMSMFNISSNSRRDAHMRGSRRRQTELREDLASRNALRVGEEPNEAVLWD